MNIYEQLVSNIIGKEENTMTSTWKEAQKVKKRH